MKVACIALVILTCLIAIDEARLPGKVQALPTTAQHVLLQGDAHAPGVYLWENMLYVFIPRDAVADGNGATFYLGTVDSHGYRTTDTFNVAASASARYSTADQLVLVVPMGRYPGYTHIVFGQLADGVNVDLADDNDVDRVLAWGGTYDKAKDTGRTLG